MTYLIFCTHEECFQSVHGCRHHSLHAVVQGKAQQEEQACVEQGGHHAALQDRRVFSTTGLREERESCNTTETRLPVGVCETARVGSCTFERMLPRVLRDRVLCRVT